MLCNRDYNAWNESRQFIHIQNIHFEFQAFYHGKFKLCCKKIQFSSYAKWPSFEKKKKTKKGTNCKGVDHATEMGMYWLVRDENGPITIKIQIYLKRRMNGIPCHERPTEIRFTAGFLWMCGTLCVQNFIMGFTTNHLNGNCVVTKWSKLLLHRKLIDLSHFCFRYKCRVLLSIFGAAYMARTYADIHILWNMCIFLDSPNTQYPYFV